MSMEVLWTWENGFRLNDQINVFELVKWVFVMSRINNRNERKMCVRGCPGGMCRDVH